MDEYDPVEAPILMIPASGEDPVGALESAREEMLGLAEDFSASRDACGGDDACHRAESRAALPRVSRVLDEFGRARREIAESRSEYPEVRACGEMESETDDALNSAYEVLDGRNGITNVLRGEIFDDPSETTLFGAEAFGVAGDWMTRGLERLAEERETCLPHTIVKRA